LVVHKRLDEILNEYYGVRGAEVNGVVFGLRSVLVVNIERFKVLHVLKGIQVQD